MRTISSVTEKNIGKKSMATFLANEIKVKYYREDTTGPTMPIAFPLKDKKMQDIRRHFFWDVDE